MQRLFVLREGRVREDSRGWQRLGRAAGALQGLRQSAQSFIISGGQLVEVVGAGASKCLWYRVVSRPDSSRDGVARDRNVGRRRLTFEATNGFESTVLSTTQQVETRALFQVSTRGGQPDVFNPAAPPPVVLLLRLLSSLPGRRSRGTCQYSGTCGLLCSHHVIQVKLISINEQV